MNKWVKHIILAILMYVIFGSIYFSASALKMYTSDLFDSQAHSGDMTEIRAHKVDYNKELTMEIRRGYQSFHIEFSKAQQDKILEAIYKWDSNNVRFNDSTPEQVNCYDIDCSDGVINITDALNNGKASVLISYNLPESEYGIPVVFAAGLIEDGIAHKRKFDFKRDSTVQPPPFAEFQWQVVSDGWEASPSNQKLIFFKDNPDYKLYVDFVIRQDASTGAVHVGHSPSTTIKQITMETQGRKADGNLFESNAGASFPFGFRDYNNAVVIIYMQADEELPPLRLLLSNK